MKKLKKKKAAGRSCVWICPDQIERQIYRTGSVDLGFRCPPVQGAVQAPTYRDAHKRGTSETIPSYWLNQ